VPLPPETGPPPPTLIGPPGPHPFPADQPPSPLPPPGERSVDPSAPSGGETRPPFNPLTEPGLPQGPGGPDIQGAGQQQFGGAIPTQGPTSGATGGIVIKQPGLDAPMAGPTGTGAGTATGQPPPQQGVWCYSEKTQESYWLPYGACPPPHMTPPTGSTAGGEPGRTPWKGLVPPEGTPPMGPTPPPMGGGPCSPPCHIKPGTTMCHCP